ncbi:MAG: DNA polymerase-3 subunit epsilon [Chloroflexi bacterium]|jgi:DNA polymerase-3 subunit epsilon|nr:MAG: DNA polymerase-3 subunit epsilon [Chloroflexota bacterium]
MPELILERPLLFVDLETTGLNTGLDRIVELTVLKRHPDGTEEIRSKRINPGIPIPFGATAVHGITDEDVAHEPPFQQYARSLREFIDGCDFAGFNAKRFDLPMLESEFRRANVEFSLDDAKIVDSMAIFHHFERRDLAAAYLKYCGKELEEAHSSAADIKATAEILDAQMEYYPELPRDVKGLHDFFYGSEPERIDSEGKFIWLEGKAALGFGKYRSRSLEEIVVSDPEYIEWISDADFSEEVKNIASDALLGKSPDSDQS